MNVEIWSDVVCPWCYIGKRRFERAVASFGHPDEVTVTYRSFELDPDAPAPYVRAGFGFFPSPAYLHVLFQPS